MGRFLKEAAEELYWLNFINPLFWIALITVGGSALLVGLIWYKLGLKKLTGRIKFEYELFTYKYDTDWCRAAYKNLTDPYIGYQKNPPLKKQLMREVCRVRLRNINRCLN